MQDQRFGLSGLGDLSGVYGTIGQNANGQTGLTDAFGNFYFFTSPNLNTMYPQGAKVSVSEDYLSITNPAIATTGVLPWTTQAGAANSYYGQAGPGPYPNNYWFGQRKSKPWYDKSSTWLLAGGVGAGLLGLYALGAFGGGSGSNAGSGSPYPSANMYPQGSLPMQAVYQGGNWPVVNNSVVQPYTQTNRGPYNTSTNPNALQYVPVLMTQPQSGATPYASAQQMMWNSTPYVSNPNLAPMGIPLTPYADAAVAAANKNASASASSYASNYASAASLPIFGNSASLMPSTSFQSFNPDTSSYLNGWNDEYDDINFLTGLGVTIDPSSPVNTRGSMPTPGTSQPGRKAPNSFIESHKSELEIFGIVVGVVTLWKFLQK
jgi:hypothetical protein